MKRLNYEQKGKLFDAMMDYGEFGEVPDFSKEPYLQLAWDFVYPRIDSDGESYQKKVSTNFYGVYCREAKKKGIEPIPFDIWNSLTNEAQRKIYDELSKDIVR